MSFAVLNKLTLIGNLAFLLSLCFRYFPFLQGSITESTILVLGLLISIFLNATWVLVCCYNLIKYKMKPPRNFISLLNVIVICIQLYLLVSGITNITNA